MANQRLTSKRANHDKHHICGFCIGKGRKPVHPSDAFCVTVWGDLFYPVEYQKKFISFVGDRIVGINPNAIVIEDELWDGSQATVANNVVKLTTYFDDPANKGIMYIQQQGDTTESVETPVLLLIPAGLVE